MEQAMIDFLNGNYVLSLSVVENNRSWSASCFYAYDAINKTLVFISHGNTTHYRILMKNPYVSGTIVSQTKNITRIQGVQFTGKAITPLQKDTKNANKIYYERFPFAKFVRAKLWIIELEQVKYTDNSLGFGKKHIWNKNEEKE